MFLFFLGEGEGEGSLGCFAEVFVGVFFFFLERREGGEG